MKRIFIAVFALVLLVNSVTVFADISNATEVDLGSNNKIVCTKNTANNEQYAYIKYISNGEEVWSIITGSYPMAMIDSVSDCYVNNGTLYYVEGYSLKAIDIESGQLEWASEDICGTSGILFDKYGNIYNHGFFGPDMVVFNKDGAVLYHHASEVYGRTYGHRIDGDTLWFNCEYDLVYGDESVRSLYIGQFKPVSVLLNGGTINFDRQPFIQEGRTLVPVRAIFEALGATVDWDPDRQLVSATDGTTNVSLTIGENRLYVNGEEKIIDVPAQLVGGRTFVPARAISEAFGCDVGWDESTYTVLVTA